MTEKEPGKQSQDQANPQGESDNQAGEGSQPQDQANAAHEAAGEGSQPQDQANATHEAAGEGSRPQDQANAAHDAAGEGSQPQDQANAAHEAAGEPTRVEGRAKDTGSGPDKGGAAPDASDAGDPDDPSQGSGSATDDGHNGKAHDDFDWDLGNRRGILYSEKEREELEDIYGKTLTVITEHELIKGTVATITDSDVVLNIGFKSDGLVSLSEFRDMPGLKLGDEIEVYVENKEDVKGQLILSRKKAKLMRAWESIMSAHNNGQVVSGKIISKTKGGLIVDVFGLETFLPGSQIDVKPIVDYDAYVNKTMEFKVVKVNEAIKNAVVSHKALIESDLELQRQEIITKLEKGQVLEGTIKNITDFGAFIDLGGIDGLLYITDISWGRVSHPSDVLSLNQKLNVVVLGFDDEKKRISLGLKQLQKHPWEVLDAEIRENTKIKGKVVNIEDYGAFLEVMPGVEGLIHVSEVSWSNQQINAREFFKLGEEYEAMVVTIDREGQRMSLSLKQLTSDPWQEVEKKYTVGSRHSGTVRNLTPYGVFVELDEFIGGMIHVSDLSWIKRFHHPSQFTKPGVELEVVIMDIDKESRKISLSHKHIEEDPWDTFESVFPVESVHMATVISADDKGGIVQLPYGLEAFVPKRHMKKADGSNAKVDESLEFKILEFERKDKRIIVSHTKALDDKKAETSEESDTKPRETKRKPAKPAVTRINKGVEKATLGELGVLDDLKSRMEAEEKENEQGREEGKKGKKS